MFGFVDKNKRLMQIILALIILPFAFWGVSSYDKKAGPAEVVATVNDTIITQQELDRALRQQQDEMRKQLGANFDSKIFDNPAMKRSVLENLIAQRLLVVQAKSVGLVVTDDQIAQLISGIEAFQEGGKFDKKRYESVLTNQNMSSAKFEARVRDELLGQQIRDAYMNNGFASDSVASKVISLNEQQRVVNVSPVSLQSFLSQAKVDDAALKNYYDQNQKDFQTPEQVKVEYVKFSVDGFLSRIEISKEDVRRFYDGHQNDFGTPEERQAAHILIAVKADAAQTEQNAAKAKAEKLLQQVRSSPDKFTELAKQNSQDPGSAAQGGDLGMFGRGMMAKPFEEAAFFLKVGEISGLVKSDFGYHIIKLEAIKQSRVLPFDEAREGIVNKLRQQKATDMFAELAEKFSNTVYEQSDTLKPAADLIGAKIEQSGFLVKGMPATEPWNAKLLQAIFSEDVIKNKRNTSAIEVATNTLVAARLLEFKPASVRAFSEVQESIRQKLLRVRAAELASKQGAALLEQLQRGDKPVLAWGADQSVTRAQHGSLDTGLVRKIFQVNADKLPQYIGEEGAQGSFVLVRVDAVKEGAAIDDTKRMRYMQQFRQMTGEAVLQAYLADVKNRTAINVNMIEKPIEQP